MHCRRRGSEKSTLMALFLGAFDYLRSSCSLGIAVWDPSNLIKSPIFTNTPCKPFCLYNAPCVHIVERSLGCFAQAMMAFGVFPLFLPLAITAFGCPEGYFCLSIKAFGAFEFIVSKYDYHWERIDIKGSSVLDLRRLDLQGLRPC